MNDDLYEDLHSQLKQHSGSTLLATPNPLEETKQSERVHVPVLNPHIVGAHGNLDDLQAELERQHHVITRLQESHVAH